jgi:hypothetical protein
MGEGQPERLAALLKYFSTSMAVDSMQIIFEVSGVIHATTKSALAKPVRGAGFWLGSLQKTEKIVR